MIFNDYKYKDNLLNFTIKQNEINGIIGKETSGLIRIIKLKNIFNGKIIINNNEIDKAKLNYLRSKIVYVNFEKKETIYQQTIYDLLFYEIISRKLKLKNPLKKIQESLKIVGLSDEILIRNYYSLSTSEKKLVLLAKALLCNPELLILENLFKFLDMKNEKRIVMLLNKMKDQYQKTIIIVSNNTDKIYKYTSHLIIFKNEKILIEGNTINIFQRISFLTKNKIEIPEIVEFTYLANKQKKANLEYHKDIRDIIKDIYKHV